MEKISNMDPEQPEPKKSGVARIVGVESEIEQGALQYFKQTFDSAYTDEREMKKSLK